MNYDLNAILIINSRRILTYKHIGVTTLRCNSYFGRHFQNRVTVHANYVFIMVRFRMCGIIMTGYFVNGSGHAFAAAVGLNSARIAMRGSCGDEVIFDSLLLPTGLEESFIASDDTIESTFALSEHIVHEFVVRFGVKHAKFRVRAMNRGVP